MDRYHLKLLHRTKVRASYDRLSDWYDLLSEYSERKFRQVSLKFLNAQPGEIVLEIGFGTGHSLASLAQQLGDRGCVHGLDLSLGMLKVARKRLQKDKLIKSVNLLLGDAVRLPYKSSSFDAIIMSFTLELFEASEIPEVLLGCYKVLKPGSRMVIVTLDKKLKNSFPIRLYEWFHQKFPDIVDCRPINARKYLDEEGFSVELEKEMIMWGLPVSVLVVRKVEQFKITKKGEPSGF